jgi:folate-dependent tRNA-U54 methylase TrmFO/GidA
MKTLLLRWTLYGTSYTEKDTLYLLKNLTKEQYKSFVEANDRFVNDDKKDIKGLTDLMNFMGIYTENCDYASIENMSQKDYKAKKYEPNLSAEEIFKHSEEIYDLTEF